MSSPSRKRGIWLSVPPPIPAPGVGDMSSLAKSTDSSPKRGETSKTNEPRSVKRGKKSPEKSPPKWHPTTDLLGKPIARKKSPRKLASLDDISLARSPPPTPRGGKDGSKSARGHDDGNHSGQIRDASKSPSHRRHTDAGKGKAAAKGEERPQHLSHKSRMRALSNAPTAVARVEPRPCSLAKQNESTAHSSRLTEEVSGLNKWESFTYNCGKLLKAFNDWNNRRSLKHVAASLYVLRTYHDGFLTGTVPVSIQLRTWLREGMLGTAWHIVLLSVILMSITLPTMDNGDDIYGSDLIRLLQFVRTLRVFDLITKLRLIGTSVTQQILHLTVATFGCIIFDAGILQWMEYFSAPSEDRDSCPVEGCLNFWQATYFLVVTISTVGYGDITPRTPWGQFVTCVTIACALIFIPIQIQRIHALASRRPYGGSFSTKKIVGSRFLIVTGSVTFPGIQRFLAEFFKPTHRQELEVYPMRVIILAPFVPSFDLKQLLTCYDGYAEFIEGSPIRQVDLERVSAHKSMAIFLLADSTSEDAKIEDAAQIVRSLAVHRFCCANCNKGQPRIIVEVMDPDTQKSAVWDEVQVGQVEVICPIRIHYRMMARSCFVQGLYTFITNLFTSELTLKYVHTRHFLTEYFHSFDNEVYPVILPPAFHNLLFEEVAELLFVKFSSTIFAVDTEIVTKSTGERSRKVLHFPRGYRIRHDDVGMVITDNLRIAFAIASYKQTIDDCTQLQRCWTYMTKTTDIRRTTTEGIQLLDPVTNRWRRSSFGLGRKASVTTGDSFGVQSSDIFPDNTDSEYTLESKMRSAIQNVFSNKEYPEWREHPFVSDSGEVEHPLDAKRDAKADQNLRFPKGVCLEQAAEKLLSWPPISKEERPHPAVVEKRESLILDNLQERRISMVAFSKPHILVCCEAGWPVHLFYFLTELRKPKFPNPPIVILYPHTPKAAEWGSVGMFEDVFYVRGSPLYELDLMRAGVLQAEKVLILADQGKPVDLGGAGLDDKLRYAKRPPAAYTSDVENIVVAANIHRLYGSAPPGLQVVEMKHSEGFHYLQPQYKIAIQHFVRKDFRRNKDALAHFGPPYMEGRVVSASMLGFLMRSTFYNRNTVSIVEQLVQGGFVVTEEGLSSARLRIFQQIPVPTGFANKAYSFLFLSLLQEKGILALGLYRARGTLGAPTSYVLTNPPKDCIVNPDDRVYVLTDLE